MSDVVVCRCVFKRSRIACHTFCRIVVLRFRQVGFQIAQCYRCSGAIVAVIEGSQDLIFTHLFIFICSAVRFGFVEFTVFLYYFFAICSGINNWALCGFAFFHINSNRAYATLGFTRYFRCTLTDKFHFVGIFNRFAVCFGWIVCVCGFVRRHYPAHLAQIAHGSGVIVRHPCCSCSRSIQVYQVFFGICAAMGGQSAVYIFNGLISRTDAVFVDGYGFRCLSARRGRSLNGQSVDVDFGGYFIWRIAFFKLGRSQSAKGVIQRECKVFTCAFNT